MHKDLFKSRNNRVISGVLGGFAETYGIDASLLRIIYTAITLFTGVMPGLLIYIVAMMVVPEK
jgi:phage shock protein C